MVAMVATDAGVGDGATVGVGVDQQHLPADGGRLEGKVDGDGGASLAALGPQAAARTLAAARAIRSCRWRSQSPFDCHTLRWRRPPELYELLVIRRAWTPQRYGRWVADTLTAAPLR
jgi:hypothetical protein